MKNDSFEQSHSVKNCKRGDRLGFFNIYYVQNIKKMERGPFGDIEKLSKKMKMRNSNNLIVAKNLKKGTSCLKVRL